MFSKHPYIANLCRSHGIIVEGNYRHNRYNLPILRNLLLYAQSIFTSKYYGYINSDVLISPDVFEALRITALLTKTGKLRSAVGFASFRLTRSTASRGGCTTCCWRTCRCRWSRWSTRSSR